MNFGCQTNKKKMESVEINRLWYKRKEKCAIPMR